MDATSGEIFVRLSLFLSTGVVYSLQNCKKTKDILANLCIYNVVETTIR